MADIDVRPLQDDTFQVTVREDNGATEHRVRVDDVPPAAAGMAPEHLVEASFRFLLDREPKESILRSFDLSVIGRYFPEYRDRIGDYL